VGHGRSALHRDIIRLRGEIDVAAAHRTFGHWAADAFNGHTAAWPVP
jgi:hypothetical protein